MKYQKANQKIISIILMTVLIFMQLSGMIPEQNVLKVMAAEVPLETTVPTEEATATPEATALSEVTEAPEATMPAMETGEPEVTPGLETMQPDTAQLRMVFTSDLHGQLTTMNYETGELRKEGTLSRAATLIKQARAEAGELNTLLFDIGDVLYDYSTDFIYDHDDVAQQPIYNAMLSLRYDAITLGNHEFDYDLPYIQNQMQSTGLTEKCVVSNLKDANTGKNIWNENKIIERTVYTSSGTSISVKVGVIGETIPKLSTKRTDYTGILQTEDIIENTTSEAAKLKEQGADIIVVLAHSGIGVENPEPMEENVAYALTKIADVDVVLCGHQHKDFPSNSSESRSYYELPGMDKQTGLANGKNLIMIADRGTRLGIADLTIQNGQEGVEIVGRESTIKKVTSDVAIDEDINNNYMGTEWQKMLISNCSMILAEIQKGLLYHNYFGTLEDTPVIQMVNNAKMEYALKYINTEKTAYKNYHVIGVSNYEKYGMSDPMDYIEIEGDLLQSYLSGIQKYKTALYLYKITGAQLREWIEWSASAYQTAGSKKISEINQVSGSAVEAKMEQNVLREEWETDWSRFFIFDGVEYVIDTTVEPRYNFNGSVINDSRRVIKLTVNGQEVKDEDTFVLASDKLSTTTPLLKEIAGKKIHMSDDRCQTYVKQYIEKNAMNGTFKVLQDNNWHVKFSDTENYVLKSGKNSQEAAKEKEWIKNHLATEEDYQFYEADFSKQNNTDVTGPNITATALNSQITNKDITVAVEANDISGILQLKYALGKYAMNSNVWDYAENIVDGKFVCKENGIYSILAVDGMGNKNIYYVRINNINKSVLQAPSVDEYDNRKKKITGKAEAGAKVYFELEDGKTYSKKVSADGTFAYSLPVQDAGKTVYVYVVDDKGRASARTVVTVKRTGPNKPKINTVNSNSKIVSGNLRDNYVTPAFLVDSNTVYVPSEGGKTIFENSDLYNPEYKVVETEFQIKEDGTVRMELSSLLPGDSLVEMYTIDTLMRKSLKCETTVVQMVPNKPEIINEEITNQTTSISVYTEEKCKSVHALVSGKDYVSSSATYNSELNLYKYTVKIPKSNSGVTVKVYATNVKGDSASVSMTKKEKAPDTPKLKTVKADAKRVDGTVHLIGADGKRTTVSESKTKVYVKIDTKKYTANVHEDGTFGVKTKKIKSGSKITYWASNVNGTGIKGSITVK